MTNPSVVHSTFTIERTYDFSPARVFAAFSDQETKRRWFAEGEGWEVDQFTLDFRIGGLETSHFRFRGGPEIRNDTVIHDIMPERRIVLSYTMTVAGESISTSLATTELHPAGAGTRVVYTEQAVFLDGKDQTADRRGGCAELLEQLARELQRKR